MGIGDQNAPDHPFSRDFCVSFAFSYVPVLERSAFQGLTAGYLLFYSWKPATTGLFGWRKRGSNVLQHVWPGGGKKETVQYASS